MTKLSFACHLQVIRVRVPWAPMQILVIEDEPRILAFLARGLEAEGFRVDCAGSGPDGRQQALSHKYDAVLLDLLLPGLDGLSVLREFRLLHHLVEHAGEVVSRERLLSEVWGYHFDPGSNVVDVCVRRLRKKLGAQAPIETVRHAGYRVAA